MGVVTLLDKNVTINRCTSRKYEELFDYLEDHPFLGMVTERTLDSTRRVIGGKLGGINYKRAISEFNRLPTYLEIRKFRGPEYAGLLHEVNQFFFKILNEHRKSLSIDPGLVSSRYRRLVKEINMNSGIPSEEERCNLGQKIFSSVPEEEDAKIIVEALCLKEYSVKFVASADRHLSEDFVSKEIEKRFEVKCRYPEKILPELEKYEHLFKRKVIL